MRFENAKFIITAVSPEQYPAAELPEIAFAGRSNVGKSSLINRLTNRKNLARTSGTPGKTATVNFYEIDGALRLVDLPGYGYAKVSRAEKEKWGQMIETYLSKREMLVQVVQLVDIRHKPSAEDVMMSEWIRRFGFYPVVVATKADKIKKSEIDANLGVIRETLKLTDAALLPFSAETGQGKEELCGLIEKIVKECHDDETSPISPL